MRELKCHLDRVVEKVIGGATCKQHMQSVLMLPTAVQSMKATAASNMLQI